MSGEVYGTEAEYEAMPVEELAKKKDLDLRFILMRVFGLASPVYFMDKVQKLRYISQPDERPLVLAEAEQRQALHRELGKENRVRPQGSVEERMAEETKDRLYRAVGFERVSAPLKDAFTGRAIRVVYTIEDMADGTRFAVSRGTCRWLEEHGKLEGFQVSRGRRSAAHAAGEKSAADLLGEVTPAAPKKKPPRATKSKVESKKEEAVVSDDELDEILNSLPS